MASKSLELNVQFVRRVFNICRECMVSNLNSHKFIDGEIIEMDETASGKRKYNRGHQVTGQTQWFVTILGRESGVVRFFEVEERDIETMKFYVTTYIRAGSEIHTDGWSAYGRLQSWGYVHKVVIHKDNFVDPQVVLILTSLKPHMVQLNVKLKLFSEYPGLTSSYILIAIL
ncbi:Conserved_hypothetical protein [Hexamita inflata]|uniref:ISXO2-like transposase domain-containing protein n=1 Tax=Hexamita inflata TaxID=28002 RepID=A0AA86PBB4_9EUKA|nr:Conserved hypothetical protein [Hexamita inflata]